MTNLCNLNWELNDRKKYRMREEISEISSIHRNQHTYSSSNL